MATIGSREGSGGVVNPHSNVSADPGAPAAGGGSLNVNAANVDAAHLSGANLSGANLSGANDGANLNAANLAANFGEQESGEHESGEQESPESIQDIVLWRGVVPRLYDFLKLLPTLRLQMKGRNRVRKVEERGSLNHLTSSSSRSSIKDTCDYLVSIEPVGQVNIIITLPPRTRPSVDK
jgi:hypothetical protein